MRTVIIRISALLSPETPDYAERPTPKQVFQLASVCIGALGTLNQHSFKNRTHYKIVESYEMASQDACDDTFMPAHQDSDPVFLRSRLSLLVKRRERATTNFNGNSFTRHQLALRAWELVIFDIYASRHSGGTHEGIARNIYRFSWDDQEVYLAQQQIAYNGYQSFEYAKELSQFLDDGLIIPDSFASEAAIDLSLRELTGPQVKQLTVDVPAKIHAISTSVVV